MIRILLFLLLTITTSVSVNAQTEFYFRQRLKGIITYMTPQWININTKTVKNNGVRNDSVFYYGTKENNQDSSLIMTEFFDSLGNIMEKDEFSVKKKGEIWRISNYTYMDNQLFKAEVVWQSSVKGVPTNIFEKEIVTYEYDSIGKVIAEKIYLYPNNTENKYTVATREKEYDSSGHIIREFLEHKGGNRFLCRTYEYDKGILSEVKTYDSSGDVSSMNTRRFDAKKNILRIYDGDYAPDNLILAFYLDDKKRVVQEKLYLEGGVENEDQLYWYNAGNLVEKQVVNYAVNGTKNYYKHYYTTHQ